MYKITQQTQMSYLYEIYLTAENQRVGVFEDGAKGAVHKSYDGKIMNSKKMDLGDLVEFDSSYYGWVEGHIIRITALPNVGDEYDVEFKIDGKTKKETVEGRYLY